MLSTSIFSSATNVTHYIEFGMAMYFHCTITVIPLVSSGRLKLAGACQKLPNILTVKKVTALSALPGNGYNPRMRFPVNQKDRRSRASKLFDK
jgi:hypothetical protein